MQGLHNNAVMLIFVLYVIWFGSFDGPRITIMLCDFCSIDS